MPDLLPPQIVGVQQRPFYVRARTVVTWISVLWLAAAVLGIGFFSGGTTNLALSLALLYGTGVALVVVLLALYRWLSGSARRRNAAAPDDAAAAVFLDATRSAQEELWAALLPPQPVGLRGVRTAVGTSEARRALAPARKSAAGAPRSSVNLESTAADPGSGGTVEAPTAAPSSNANREGAAAVVPVVKAARPGTEADSDAQAGSGGNPARSGSGKDDAEAGRPLKSAVSKKAVRKSGKKSGRKRPPSSGQSGTGRPSAAKSGSGRPSTAQAKPAPGKAGSGSGSRGSGGQNAAASGNGNPAGAKAKAPRSDSAPEGSPPDAQRTRDLLAGNGRGHLTLTPGLGPASPSPHFSVNSRGPRTAQRNGVPQRSTERKAS